VPISELVFGALTQNSLEPTRGKASSFSGWAGFAAIAGTSRIVNHARYVQAPEEPIRDPKRLWRIRPDVNVVPVPPRVRKINSKGTAAECVAPDPKRKLGRLRAGAMGHSFLAN
jgi:hypothetical protein